MGVSGAIKAGRSFVELFCDNAPLIEGLPDSYPPPDLDCGRFRPPRRETKDAPRTSNPDEVL